MKVLDLFSGIGGFSLGLERAGMKTVAFCEIDPFCRRVLAKHWPYVPCHEDVRSLKGSDVGHVDVICGGPPCQPISSASRGRRKGLEDDRWLWPEMYRLARELRPTWIILENVSLLDGMGLEQILSDMETMDYEGRPFRIEAGSVRLDHIRPRCWVVGYANRQGQSNLSIHAKMEGVPQHHESNFGKLGASNEFSGRMDRLRRKAIGNAVVPKIVEQFGHAIMATKNPPRCGRPRGLVQREANQWPDTRAMETSRRV